MPLLSGSATYAGPATPHSLTGVSVSSDVRTLLKDPAVLHGLLRKGFVIVPSEIPLFSMAYDSQAYSGTPVFVTTDAIYDTWHLVFDKVLRQLETTQLLPRLKSLVSGMLAHARTQASELAGTSLADPADRVVQLLQVAGQRTGPAGRARWARVPVPSGASSRPTTSSHARRCWARTSTTPCSRRGATTRAAPP